jgi:homocysteine S-methyltransferase
MAGELKGLKPRSRSISLIGPVTTTAPPVYEETITTQYKKTLEEGFSVSVELDPPKDPNIDKFLKKIEKIAPFVQAFNISDCPMARARMSSIATGNIIQRQLNKEVIIHYTCRDRNILGIQSDLLGAAALGLNNILTLGGDPPAVGDYPFATGVYDLTTEGLVQLCSALNHGRDLLGNPLGKPTQFYIGVGFNINDQSPRAFEALIKKIDQGAHFIVTQPVFNIPAFWSSLEKLKQKNIPVVVGALPLTSFKQAEYLHYEVPGIVIPEIFLARLEKLKAKEAEREGVKITVEIIKELRPAVNGILLMISFNKLYLLEEIMTKI